MWSKSQLSVSHIKDCLDKKPMGAEEQHDLIYALKGPYDYCVEIRIIQYARAEAEKSVKMVLMFRDDGGFYQGGSSGGDEKQLGYI